MKILILGGTGMIGSNLYIFLKTKNLDIYFTTRSKKISLKYKNAIYFKPSKNIENLSFFKKYKFIINAIGITNKFTDIDDKHFFFINSEFPHLINKYCYINKIKLLHLSTNCIYDGNSKTSYKEHDIPNAKDIYGYTKSLAEINSYNLLVLRFSCIGLEFKNHHQLFNWFINQKHEVTGYGKVMFNGITTIVLAEIIFIIITKYKHLHGIFNISSSESISKYNLLKTILDNLIDSKVKLIKDNSIKSNKTLNSDKFNHIIKYNIPSYQKMVKDLCNAFYKI